MKLAHLTTSGVLLIVVAASPALSDDGDNEGGSATLDMATYATQGSNPPAPGVPEVSGTSTGATVEYSPSCGLGGQYICYETDPCVEVGADGESYEGILYDILQNGEVVGQTCVTDAPGEPDAPPQVTPGMVLRAFQRLTWPASELVIQPPNGRTAVNFDTYFYTDDTAPLTQTVRLLGQRVTIEATPTSFTWRYGDDTTETTSTPGGPYPGGTVIHQYLRTGASAPSLDTTYTGRFRVSAGPWVGIPDSLTVAGAPQQLEVVEIDLKLVYDY
jgi:hypothetical protein